MRRLPSRVGCLFNIPTCRARSDAPRQAEAIAGLRRFSRLGHGAVALVIASGFLNIWLILGRWPKPGAGPYQALLWLKMVLVALMTGLALLNRYAFAPKLGEAPHRAVRRIRVATVAELLLGTGVIALVAVFGLLDPA